MVPEAYRKTEDTFAVKQRYDLASDAIALSNTLIRDNKEIDSQITRLSRVATKSGDKELAAHLADTTMRSQLKAITSHSITRAQEVKSRYESDQSKPASSLKSRCHWIASLISSGALPGWSWYERTSVDGPVVTFGRVNAPPELKLVSPPRTKSSRCDSFMDSHIRSDHHNHYVKTCYRPWSTGDSKLPNQKVVAENLSTQVSFRLLCRLVVRSHSSDQMEAWARK